MNAEPAAAPGEVRGSVTPRLWTPPLVTGPPGPCGCGCALTATTSYGYDLIDFSAQVLNEPQDRWQRWLSIHAGELLPDGRPRFRVLLVLVARQNGKSRWAQHLILYWQYVESAPLIVASSTDRSYAKRAWLATMNRALEHPDLGREVTLVHRTLGEEHYVAAGSEYTFGANNGRLGRSRTVHRALVDEVREHRNLDAWDSLSNAANAVRDAQILMISNQGDAGAVLLDMIRDPALAYIETGQGDPRTGLMEWSAPPGADPTEVTALAQANPDLGGRLDTDALLSAAARAKRAGGEELSGFRTEIMVQRVQLLDPAIEPDAWHACGTADPVDLAQHRNRVALCLDVALDATHATLVAAASIEGTVHLDVVAAWDGRDCLEQVRRELPAVVARVRPRVVGWLPGGPTAALAADLAERPRAGWPPRRVKLEPISAEVPAVCMALPGLVLAGQIRHGCDPLLDKHATEAQRQRQGDRWVFGRRGSGPIDAVYAAAGAAHLARTLPPPPPPLHIA